MMETMSAAQPSPAGRALGKIGKARNSMARGLAKAVRAGRVSSAFVGTDSQNVSTSLKKLHEQYAPLGYMLPWETIDYVELLSTYNPDYSQAVENIKMLSNTGHTVIVDAASDLQRRKTKDFLDEKARLLQPNHGGVDGIIEKLMDQAATYGAMCGEWVLNDALTEVVDFVDLNPKRIRFFWVEDVQRWVPHQKVSRAQAIEAEKAGQTIRNGDCVELNEETFMYHAFDAAPESPYGVPPFLAALQNIAIQRDIVFNMAQIVKKIGILGMIDLSITALEEEPGETPEAYQQRCEEYLSEYVTAAEDMARDGGLVHFDDVTVQTTQLGGNAAGATNIHKANEEMVFSGLKSMPSVQGRSYSTTETYAGVAYEIIIRNTWKYQRAAKRFIERGYWLMATMGGYNPDSIKLQFNENRSLNRLQDAQAEKVEISNSFMKWLLGIIDQESVAHELGYSSPKTPMDTPPESLVSIASAHSSPEPDKGDLRGGSQISETMEVEDAELADA